MRDHINAIGANIAYTVYRTSSSKKRLRFKDFLMVYKDKKKESKDLESDFMRFEKNLKVGSKNG